MATQEMETLSQIVKANADFLFYLKDRWQDEREYEDFSEYVFAVKAKLSSQEVQVIKMDKRFTISVLINNKPAEIKIQANGIRTTIKAH